MSKRLRVVLLATSTLLVGALAPRAGSAATDPFRECLDDCWVRYQLCLGVETTPPEDCDAFLHECNAQCYA